MGDRLTSFLNLIRPTNIDQEKERFFSSKTYNPQFTYSWEEYPIDAEQYLDRKLKYHELLKAVISQDYNLISQKGAELYDVSIQDETLSKAYETIRLPREQGREETITQLAESLKRALLLLEIPYSVELTSKAEFTFRPNHKKKTLFLSKTADLRYMTVNGVIKHELTHIIRNVNAKHNQIQRDADYLPTEEGLATYLQDVYFQPDTRARHLHALQYIVTAKALSDSFRSVYDMYVSHGIDTNFAWKKAVRQKLGLKDTSRPGSIMKSAMYYSHSLQFHAFDEADLWRLFVGKIAVRNLNKHQSYSGIIPLRKIKQLYQTDWCASSNA